MTLHYNLIIRKPQYWLFDIWTRSYIRYTSGDIVVLHNTGYLPRTSSDIAIEVVIHI